MAELTYNPAQFVPGQLVQQTNTGAPMLAAGPSGVSAAGANVAPQISQLPHGTTVTLTPVPSGYKLVRIPSMSQGFIKVYPCLPGATLMPGGTRVPNAPVVHQMNPGPGLVRPPTSQTFIRPGDPNSISVNILRPVRPPSGVPLQLPSLQPVTVGINGAPNFGLVQLRPSNSSSPANYGLVQLRPPAPATRVVRTANPQTAPAPQQQASGERIMYPSKGGWQGVPDSAVGSGRFVISKETLEVVARGCQTTSSLAEGIGIKTSGITAKPVVDGATVAPPAVAMRQPVPTGSNGNVWKPPEKEFYRAREQGGVLVAQPVIQKVKSLPVEAIAVPGQTIKHLRTAEEMFFPTNRVFVPPVTAPMGKNKPPVPGAVTVNKNLEPEVFIISHERPLVRQKEKILQNGPMEVNKTAEKPIDLSIPGVQQPAVVQNQKFSSPEALTEEKAVEEALFPETDQTGFFIAQPTAVPVDVSPEHLPSSDDKELVELQPPAMVPEEAMEAAMNSQEIEDNVDEIVHLQPPKIEELAVDDEQDLVELTSDEETTFEPPTDLEEPAFAPKDGQKLPSFDEVVHQKTPTASHEMPKTTRSELSSDEDVIVLSQVLSIDKEPKGVIVDPVGSMTEKVVIEEPNGVSKKLITSNEPKDVPMEPVAMKTNGQKRPIDLEEVVESDKKQKVDQNAPPLTIKRWRCQFCGYEDDAEDRFASHLMVHYEEPPVQKVVPKMANVARFQQYRCTMCPKKFDRLDCMTRHVQLHAEQHPCFVCKKMVTSDETHENCASKGESGGCLESLPIRRTLLSSAPLKCPTCAKESRNPKMFHDHITFCKAIRELAAKGSCICPQCRRHFSDRFSFFQHVFSHTHPHSCKPCSSRFRSPMMLNNHVCDDEKFSCQTCGAARASIRALNNHKLSHNQPLHHYCIECGEQFMDARQFLKHECTEDAAWKGVVYVCRGCDGNSSGAAKQQRGQFLLNGPERDSSKEMSVKERWGRFINVTPAPSHAAILTPMRRRPAILRSNTGRKVNVGLDPTRKSLDVTDGPSTSGPGKDPTTPEVAGKGVTSDDGQRAGPSNASNDEPMEVAPIQGKVDRKQSSVRPRLNQPTQPTSENMVFYIFKLPEDEDEEEALHRQLCQELGASAGEVILAHAGNLIFVEPEGTKDSQIANLAHRFADSGGNVTVSVLNTGSSTALHRCEGCQYQFRSGPLLQDHRRSCQRLQRRPIVVGMLENSKKPDLVKRKIYHCPYCSLTTQVKPTILEHLRYHHSAYEADWDREGFMEAITQTLPERLISCTMCHRKVASVFAWRFHILTHRGNDMTCRRCCKCFTRRHNFNTHEGTQCRPFKFPCLLCTGEKCCARTVEEYFEHIENHPPLTSVRTWSPPVIPSTSEVVDLSESSQSVDDAIEIPDWVLAAGQPHSSSQLSADDMDAERKAIDTIANELAALEVPEEISGPFGDLEIKADNIVVSLDAQMEPSDGVNLPFNVDQPSVSDLSESLLACDLSIVGPSLEGTPADEDMEFFNSEELSEVLPSFSDLMAAIDPETFEAMDSADMSPDGDSVPDPSPSASAAEECDIEVDDDSVRSPTPQPEKDALSALQGPSSAETNGPQSTRSPNGDEGYYSPSSDDSQNNQEQQQKQIVMQGSALATPEGAQRPNEDEFTKGFSIEILIDVHGSDIKLPSAINFGRNNEGFVEFMMEKERKNQNNPVDLKNMF